MQLKNILLIDDSEIDNFINKSVLVKANITETIRVETSAVNALDYLKKQTITFPDIIFLDIRMPEMDGFEFLEECVNFPENLKSKCSVFMLSSSIDPKDALRAAQYSSVKKYLTKPLTQDVINTILKDF